MPAPHRSMSRALVTVIGVLLAACAPSYAEVHVVAAEPVPAPVVTDVVVTEVLDDGTRVEAVTYVHSAAAPVTTYPSIAWGDRVYYNVDGSFVHFNPDCHCWVYYRVPPPPLVIVWNHAHPARPFMWVHGHAGPGWYWGPHVHHPPPHMHPSPSPRPHMHPRPSPPRPSPGRPGPGPSAAPGGPRGTFTPRHSSPAGPRPSARPGTPRPRPFTAPHGGPRRGR